MIAYKGFRPGLICRGYQFVMGLNTTEKANCRENGFHCAEDPLDCLSYYSSLEHSEYYIVNAGGDIDEDEHDSKIACTELTVIKRLTKEELFLHGLAYMVDHPRRVWSSHVAANRAMANCGYAVVRGKDPVATGRLGDILAFAKEAPDSESIVQVAVGRIDGVTLGLVALALCPLVQYGSQLIVEAEYRNPNYDFSTLFENVVWGNTQMFFPISLVMIGSWLIDRESTHDTLKNIMTIPVSMPKMLGAKLFWVGIFAVLLGIYSVGVTLLTGLTVGLSGLTTQVFFHGGTQIVLAALTTYLVCMPLILIFGQIRGAYLGGSILAFFLGYSMLFFKGGILASIYPFSAALILVGFDMSGYAGTTTAPNPLLAVIGVGIMVLWAVLLLVMSNNKKEMKARKQANAKGKGKRTVRRKGR